MLVLSVSCYLPDLNEAELTDRSIDRIGEGGNGETIERAAQLRFNKELL